MLGTILHLALLIGLASSIAVTSTEQDKRRIIEANHFFSNYQIETTYAIASVDPGKSIILFLKKMQENSVFTNNITISLVSGAKSSECLFTSFDKMCFLDGLPSAEVSLRLRCDHLPCEAAWTIMQPPKIRKVEQDQQIYDLFDISESKEHMIAMVSCNNPAVENFNNKIKAYSESDYVRGYTNNIIYFLFSREKQGHLYFVVDDDAISCAKLAVYNVNKEMAIGLTLKDFILPSNYSQFTFLTRPTQQFRLDCSMHELNKEPISSDLIIEVVANKNENEEQLVTHTLKPGFPTTVYDFSFAVPPIAPEFEKLRIRMKSNNKIIMINFEMREGVVEVEETEHSHFSLQPKQVLSYKIVPGLEAEESEKLRIFVDSIGKLILSKTECLKKQGCQFSVTANAHMQGSIYIGKQEKSQSTRKEVSFQAFTNRYTHKIREDDTIYLKRTITKNQVFQVVVNNPNVLIYASSAAKCATPSNECYEKIGNLHSPFIYQSKTDGELLLAVEGLDNCEFTLTTINSGIDGVTLHDSVPFAYLMDDMESSLEFLFENPNKSAVSISLISPMNSLLLVVSQGSETPNPDEDQASADGFLSFSSQEIQSKQLRILVRKTELSKKEFIHFTLLASTAGANLRLDAGVVQYITLKSKEHRDYIFEFDKKEDYILNFFTSNLQGQQKIKLPLMVSNEDKWTDKKVEHFTIDETADVMNLRDVSQKLCSEEDTSRCQIFIRIVNGMDIEIDLEITLLVKDSVIELKDGIWQSYAINTIAKTSHFFFQPKSQNKSVSIIYKASLVDLGVAYSIWKSDEKNMDPGSWPFPLYQEDIVDEFAQFNSINHVLIDHASLKGCWPSCLILISLYKKKNILDKYEFSLEMLEKNVNFSIMVSNQIIELPERTKIDIFLREKEEKYIMLDLKHAMEKEALTFFTSTTLGLYVLTANVYSERQQRCPHEQESDFSFGEVETQIKITSIESKLKELGMQDDEDLHLCLLAEGAMETKLSIEYTSEEEIMKVLKFDSFEHVQLVANKPKYFQLEAWQKYEIKFTRESGFFFAKLVVCDNKKSDYETCLDDMKSDSDKGKEVMTKTQEFAEEPCQKCIVFIRLEAKNPAQAIIHIQSKYSMVALKEKDVLSDFINEGEQNKYSVVSAQGEDTVINLEVSEGEPVVTVTDYGSLNLEKQKGDKSSNIHIVIPPVEEALRKSTELTPLGGVNYNAFRYSSTFRYLMVTVKSKNPKMPASYTISYSSGDRQTYLQDGLLLGYTLEAKKLAKFLYRNPDKTEQGFVTISMNKSSSLYNLELKMYTMSDANDEDSKVQVTPQKPEMRKKTLNPSITYSLPIAVLVSIEMSSEEQAKVTLMVNHKQVILLPFEIQFPFQLKNNQSLNLFTDVNSPGYILLTIRKCDDTEPVFGYTFDYDAYQKSEFEYSTTMEADPKFQFYIKASKIGTLYMQINSTNDNGLFSIKATYSPTKISTGRVRPGNNGVIQYTIADSKTASVTISGVVCATGKCSSSMKYYWGAHKNMQDVYTQTICPYSYFETVGVTSVSPIKFNKISSSGLNPDNQITFEYPLLDQVSYLSVKAVSDDGNEQVFYKPLEILTVWGSLNQKTSWMPKLTLGAAAVLCLCVCLVVIRRLRRGSSYDKLPEELNEYY